MYVNQPSGMGFVGKKLCKEERGDSTDEHLTNKIGTEVGESAQALTGGKVDKKLERRRR